MKKLMAVLAAGVLFQGCLGGGAQVYPDTDVIEPKDFGDPKVAQGISKSGGVMHSGSLEYAGAGELVQVYRDYVAAMKSQGWNGAADDIQATKAVGTLRKDNRTCALEFTSSAGTIRATIKISQTK